MELVFIDELTDEEIESENGGDEDFEIEPEERISKDVPYSYKQKCVEFIFTKNGQRRKFSSIKHKFKRLTSQSQLARWQRDVAIGGNRSDKMKELNTFILERFTKEQQLKGRVRNADICKWAVEKGQELGLTGFKASNSWLHQFKKNSHIARR